MKKTQIVGAAYNAHDVEAQFVEAMRRRHLAVPRNGLIGDGKIHRVDVADKQPGNNDGAYVLHRTGRIACGGFQNWCDGQDWQKWREELNGRTLTADELAEISRAEAAEKDQYRKEKTRRQAKARVRARNLWKAAEPASADFKYCQTKKVEPEGLRMLRFRSGTSVLLVPMFNDNHIYNLQMIDADGRKAFLKGGRAEGLHFWVAEPGHDDRKTICVAEGWATGESIFEATNSAVIIAFSAGNLESVATWVHETYSDYKIILCADDDWQKQGNPGLEYARNAARAVGGLIAIPDFGKDRKNDETDFNDLAAAYGLKAVREDIEAASQPEMTITQAADSAQSAQVGEDKQAQTDTLIALADDADLFHSQEGVCYASVEVNDHIETWPIPTRGGSSSGFASWLRHRFYRKMRSAPNPQALTSALATLAAKARYDGSVQEVYVRIAAVDDRIYLDLGDEAWHVIEIDATGWRVVAEPPVRFLRRRGMLPLPMPVHPQSRSDCRKAIDKLAGYINVASDEDFCLLVSALLAALRGRGPFVVLVLMGEAGAAKSTLQRLLKALIDPSRAPLRAPPRETRDMCIAANNSYLIALDNLSDMPSWLSDMLCRLSTGGGFGTRALFTDDEEMLFDAMRPMVLTSIDNVILRGDLADRALFLTLQSIPDERRREEEEFWALFDRDRPIILGSLLDIIAAAVKELPNVKLATAPRMADFARWAVACEKAAADILWEPGSFADAYAMNRAGAAHSVIEEDLVANAIRRLIKKQTNGLWQGEASALLSDLNKLVDETIRQNKSWPKAPNALSKRMNKAAGVLRKIGVEITSELAKKTRRRVWRIVWKPATPG